jgi:hypothetical protein
MNAESKQTLFSLLGLQYHPVFFRIMSTPPFPDTTMHSHRATNRESVFLTESVNQIIVGACFRFMHVGGIREIGGNPRTQNYRNTGTTEYKAQSTKDEETKNLQKTDLTSKVVNLFTRALGSPFIRRRRDFYISKIPSNLGNIPYVNMYMNVFYTS